MKDGSSNGLILADVVVGLDREWLLFRGNGAREMYA